MNLKQCNVFYETPYSSEVTCKSGHIWELFTFIVLQGPLQKYNIRKLWVIMSITFWSITWTLIYWQTCMRTAPHGSAGSLIVRQGGIGFPCIISKWFVSLPCDYSHIWLKVDMHWNMKESPQNKDEVIIFKSPQNRSQIFSCLINYSNIAKIHVMILYISL